MITRLESALLVYLGKLVKYIHSIFFYWLAKRITDGYFYFIRRGKKEIINNLKYFIPTSQVKKTAHKIFHNFGINLVDFYRTPVLNKYNINKWVEIKGLEYLDEALRQNRGVIGVTAHLGNWEWVNIILSLKGYKMNAIYAPFGYGGLIQLFQKLRAYGGTKPISIFKLKEAVLALKRKEILGLTIDRNFSSTFVVVNFFGRKVAFPKGIAKFACKHCAPVIMIFCLRIKDKYELILERAVEMKYTKDKTKDIIILTQKIVNLLEKYIRKYSEQWYLFHPLKEIK